MNSSKTILVVEDADEVRKLVCGTLSIYGYECLAAANGFDALRLIESDSQPLDLLLTDMMMPEMLGSELARHAARLRPELRIMLMSGFSDDPLVRTYQQYSAGFLAKPFTAATLCAKVRQALDQPWFGIPDDGARRV